MNDVELDIAALSASKATALAARVRTALKKAGYRSARTNGHGDGWEVRLDPRGDRRWVVTVAYRDFSQVDTPGDHRRALAQYVDALVDAGLDATRHRDGLCVTPRPKTAS